MVIGQPNTKGAEGVGFGDGVSPSAVEKSIDFLRQNVSF
jgi:hypothetical protein